MYILVRCLLSRYTLSRHALPDLFRIISLLLLFFFFSSRRRHTRSLCDWSSDVCSSDLGNAVATFSALTKRRRRPVATSSPHNSFVSSLPCPFESRNETVRPSGVH